MKINVKYIDLPEFEYHFVNVFGVMIKSHGTYK